MKIDSWLLAEMAVEVANFYPDNSSEPRAEWRWHMVDRAIEIIEHEKITKDTTDLDEIVYNYLCKVDGFAE
jgi:predicted nuclease with RNAse H fold